MFLRCVLMTHVECIQGAVLVAVQGGAPFHQIVPWVLFGGALRLRAEGQISKGAPRWRNHGADSVRDPQETLVTARVGYVGVAAALHEVGVKLRTAPLFLDVRAPDQCVEFEGFLRLQYVCCFIVCHHPALHKQTSVWTAALLNNFIFHAPC